MTLTASQLDTLARQVEARVYRQLIQALQKLRAGIDLTAVERALLDANREALEAALGVREFGNIFHGIHESTERVRAEAWLSAAGEVGDPKRVPNLIITLPAFTGGNPDALRWIRDNALRRIQHVTQRTIEAIRGVLTRAMTRGTPPFTTARTLKAIVGLTPQQAEAVERYRARLDTEDRDPDQIERMVQRRADEMARTRARVIATTETYTALAEGKQAQWDRLQREGVIDTEDWEREWVTADDERVCPTCGSLHGVRAPLNEPFVSALETVMNPPVHPNCRCIARMVLRGFRAGEEPSPRRRERLRELGRR